MPWCVEILPCQALTVTIIMRLRLGNNSKAKAEPGVWVADFTFVATAWWPCRGWLACTSSSGGCHSWGVQVQSLKSCGWEATLNCNSMRKCYRRLGSPARSHIAHCSHSVIEVLEWRSITWILTGLQRFIAIFIAQPLHWESSWISLQEKLPAEARLHWLHLAALFTSPNISQKLKFHYTTHSGQCCMRHIPHI